VELVDGPAGGEQQGVLIAGCLVCGGVGRTLEECASGRGHGAVFLLADRAAGDEVVAVGLAVVGVGGEGPVGVQPVGPVGVLGVDRPGDPGGAAQLGVGQS